MKQASYPAIFLSALSKYLTLGKYIACSFPPPSPPPSESPSISIIKTKKVRQFQHLAPQHRPRELINRPSLISGSTLLLPIVLLGSRLGKKGSFVKGCLVIFVIPRIILLLLRFLASSLVFDIFSLLLSIHLSVHPVSQWFPVSPVRSQFAHNGRQAQQTSCASYHARPAASAASQHLPR